jgi:drug/metabolite transporter (DMT)-like permease
MIQSKYKISFQSMIVLNSMAGVQKHQMLSKFRSSAYRIWTQWIGFLHFIRDHRIEINPADWFKGVALLLLGWGLLGIDAVIFREPINSMGYKINFTVQFTAGVLFIILIRFLYKLLIPRSLGVVEFLKISHENEISGSAILAPTTRKKLIFTRGLIGAGGYIGFQLARIAVGTIDNAIIYGADSLMYVLLAIILLKERYSLREWSGILIIICGISVIALFDLMDMNRDLAIKGCLLGLSSSFSLAIILVLTSIIVQHDHPIRVIFYQCFCGLIISLFFVLISAHGIGTFEFASFDIKSALEEGLLYAVACICFLQAFYYVDPIIVAISSYSLDLYIVLFNSLINNELINAQTGVSAVLIALGSAILVRAEYRKFRKKHENDMK